MRVPTLAIVLLAIIAGVLAGCDGIGCVERTPDGRGITACGGLS